MHALRCFLGLTNYFRKFIQGYDTHEKGAGVLQEVPAIPWDSYKGSVDNDILDSFKAAYTSMSPLMYPGTNLVPFSLPVRSREFEQAAEVQTASQEGSRDVFIDIVVEGRGGGFACKWRWCLHDSNYHKKEQRGRGKGRETKQRES